jgi:hypothetical protein
MASRPASALLLLTAFGTVQGNKMVGGRFKSDFESLTAYQLLEPTGIGYNETLIDFFDYPGSRPKLEDGTLEAHKMNQEQELDYLTAQIVQIERLRREYNQRLAELRERVDQLEQKNDELQGLLSALHNWLWEHYRMAQPQAEEGDNE